MIFLIKFGKSKKNNYLCTVFYGLYGKEEIFPTD